MMHRFPPKTGPVASVAFVALAIGLVSACSQHPAGSSMEVAGPSSFGSFAATADGAPGLSLGDYLAGNHALNTGHLDEAAVFFGRALDANPEDGILVRQVYLLTLAGGRYEEAIDLAERAIALDSSDSEARLLIALDQVQDGDFADARDTLDQVGERGVAGLATPFLDAWAVFGEGGENSLDRSLERLDEGESLGALNTYHSAMMLDLGGRPESASDKLRDGMPSEGPAPVRLVQAQASLLARQGDTDAASDLVREQLVDRPDQPILADALATLEAGGDLEAPFDDSAGGMADALLGIAQALHQERGGARAVLYARLALFLKPDLAEATLLIGDVHTGQENLDAAIASYGTIDDTSPVSFAARLRTADALHDLERKDEAFDMLERLAVDQPEQVQALVQMGNLHRRDERFDQAENAYSRAIERIGAPGPEHWSLFYARGIAYERTKQWPKAEADFKQALELQPEQPFVLNYLGYSWVDMGMNLDEARGMLDRAVALRPDDGYIVDSLGWVHYRLGEYPQAVEVLERAVELEPGDPVINDHLGDAYWRVGREREAHYQWQRALTLDPDEELIEEIKEKLKSGLPAADRA